MASEFYRDPGAQGWFDWLARWWDRENAMRIDRSAALRYANRAEWDGTTTQKGDLIPKESV